MQRSFWTLAAGHGTLKCIKTTTIFYCRSSALLRRSRWSPIHVCLHSVLMYSAWQISTASSDYFCRERTEINQRQIWTPSFTKQSILRLNFAIALNSLHCIQVWMQVHASRIAGVSVIGVDLGLQTVRKSRKAAVLCLFGAIFFQVCNDCLHCTCAVRSVWKVSTRWLI
jgi:hypothetical protein